MYYLYEETFRDIPRIPETEMILEGFIIVNKYIR